MEISDYTDIISSIAVVTSIFYLAKQIKYTNKIHADNHEWNRRIETRRTLDKYNSLGSVDTLEDEFKFLRATQPIALNTIEKKLKANDSIRLAIVRLLNYYEGLANGIDMGIYDEVIIRETRKNSMIRTYKAFKNYIEYHRGEGNPIAFIKYELLNRKWLEEEKQGIKLKPIGKI